MISIIKTKHEHEPLDFPKADGYWIGPREEIITLNGNRKHIDEVITDPALFGYTLDSIKSIYVEENEPLGIEGRARERILLVCIDRGWMRLRRYARELRWTINLKEMTPVNLGILSIWAKAMMRSGYLYDYVTIDLPQSRTTYSMKEIADKAF